MRLKPLVLAVVLAGCYVVPPFSCEVFIRNMIVNLTQSCVRTVNGVAEVNAGCVALIHQEHQALYQQAIQDGRATPEAEIRFWWLLHCLSLECPGKVVILNGSAVGAINDTCVDAAMRGGCYSEAYYCYHDPEPWQQVPGFDAGP